MAGRGHDKGAIRRRRYSELNWSEAERETWHERAYRAAWPCHVGAGFGEGSKRQLNWRAADLLEDQ
jgi:hypothetical protein